MAARIIVLGNINQDFVMSAERMPQPGETVLGSDLRFVPGGKAANQAVTAARLGAETTIIGRVGWAQRIRDGGGGERCCRRNGRIGRAGGGYAATG